MGRPPDSMPLGDARQWLRERVDDGETCPCCTQLAKVYRRKIHSTMARELIRMARAGGWAEQNPVHVVGLSHQNAPDLVKTRYWGLVAEVEPDDRRDDGSKRTGWWFVTDRGLRWARGLTTVPKYARVYDGRCLGLTGDEVTIRDALGDRFNYDELMSG